MLFLGYHFSQRSATYEHGLKDLDMHDNLRLVCHYLTLTLTHHRPVAARKLEPARDDVPEVTEICFSPATADGAEPLFPAEIPQGTPGHATYKCPVLDQRRAGRRARGPAPACHAMRTQANQVQRVQCMTRVADARCVPAVIAKQKNARSFFFMTSLVTARQKRSCRMVWYEC
jgi:hypothetical protein